MAISLCIPRAAMWANQTLIQILFDKAFKNVDGNLIRSIVLHERTDPISKEKYKTIFIYFNYTTKELSSFREKIAQQGSTQFIFGSRFNDATLRQEYAIIQDTTSFNPSDHQKLFIWPITE
jgi:hypothetical protein